MREMVCTAFSLLMAPVMGALAVDEREGYNITVSIKVDEQKQDGRPWDAGGTNALPDIRGTIIFINDNEKALGNLCTGRCAGGSDSENGSGSHRISQKWPPDWPAEAVIGLS